MTATTLNYTGKIFHIPVYGETWLNCSYYPWNGKLDSWDWMPSNVNAGPATNPTPRFCGDPGLPNYVRLSEFIGMSIGQGGPSPTVTYQDPNSDLGYGYL